MTQQHPVTPPPELVEELWDKFRKTPIGGFGEAWRQIMVQAAQWGVDQANADIERKLQEAADQELEACRQWLEINGAPCKFIDGLLVARRPKPQSLKKEALDILNDAHRGDLSDDEMATIRRALESIPDPSR